MITRRNVLLKSLLVSGAAFDAWATLRLGARAEELASIRGAGSTFAAPLYKKWIEAFQQDHKQVALSYDVVGSGAGVDRFVAGSVDFGATDVLPSDVMLASVKRGAVPVPVTAGIIVLAYNLPGFKGVLKLPRDVYSAIFSGRITQWNDPQIRKANPDLISAEQRHCGRRPAGQQRNDRCLHAPSCGGWRGLACKRDRRWISRSTGPQRPWKREATRALLPRYSKAMAR